MSTKQKENLKNELAEIELEKAEGLLCKSKVHLTPSCVNTEYNKTIQELSKKASLPGFRKGRLPKVMLVKNFGKDIDRRWRELLSQKALIETMILGKVNILQEVPTLKTKINSASLEKGAEVELEFEMQPQIDNVDVSDIKLEEVKEEKIDDKKIEEMIERMRLYFATWNDAKHKELKKGDFVDLDINNLDDNGAALFKDKRFKMDPDSMAGWMYKALEKAKVGDKIEATSKLDKDAPQEVKDAFKATKVEIIVKGIKTAELPKIDEDFAKKVGSKNVDDLKVNAEKMLKNQEQERVRKDEVEQFVEKLLKKYTFDVPKTMLARQKGALVDQFLRAVEENPGFEKTIVDRRTQIDTNAAIQAEKIVRLHFLVSFVAAKENLRPGQNEIMQYLVQNLPPETLKALSDPKHAKQRDAYVQDAIFALTQNKVLNLLIEKIKKK